MRKTTFQFSPGNARSRASSFKWQNLVLSSSCVCLGLSKKTQEQSLHLFLGIVFALVAVFSPITLPHCRHLSAEADCALQQVTQVIIPLLTSKALGLSALFSNFLSNGGNALHKSLVLKYRSQAECIRPLDDTVFFSLSYQLLFPKL